MMRSRLQTRVAIGILLLCPLPCPALRTRAVGAVRKTPLQRSLATLMQGRRGAAIISDPRTGELLSVWNPQVAFEAAFPPGSTAKLVESAAALEEGLISSDERIFCRRVPELLGEPYHCSHPPPSESFTLTLALANSCNYFFAALSARVSPASLAHWYSVFGFGSPEIGPGLSSTAGKVHVGTEAAEKAKAAVGEATILASPAQLLLAYSAVANQGGVYSLWQPRARRSSSPTHLLRRIKLKQQTLGLLAAGLEACVLSGTGQAAAVPGIRVAGKTGTATALDGSQATHAWFVGYAPAEDPQVALVVFLERGTGAHDAAPLAGKILKCYFALKSEKQ